jgi:hypothetical protein
MALEIFWGSGSPFSWRVLLGAEIVSSTQSVYASGPERDYDEAYEYGKV